MADVFDRLKAALADRYNVDRELGRGGMATVYLAQDLKHERQVAVKVLHPEIAEAIGSERFLRETKTTARLAHPNILPLLDSGEIDGFLFYTMPFVEGESLRERLNRETQLPVEDALRYAAEVADALGSAHRHNVVHRDIKPENILLEEGHAVVADFGIARAISETEPDRLTETGVSVGTPLYMSPEQAAGERTIDGRSDTYSLGCVLYEMLAGQAPFTGPTIESIVRQHLTEEPQPVSRLRPSVPVSVVKTLARALAKSPADRQTTADAFATELKNEAASIVSGITERTTEPPFPYRTVGIIAGSALLLLAIIYGVVILVGLPDWVFAMAAALTVAGLPALLYTGFVERYRSAGLPVQVEGTLGRVYTWISWRRFLLGAAIAFSALGVIAAAYMLSRSLGIGPAATLMAQGVIGERDALVLADFEDHTGDSTLARALTEAIRTDLSQSPVVKLLSAADVVDALRRMQRPPGAPVPPPVALEIAQREGLKAIVAGEIHAAGTGFVLSARVVAAESNEVLTAVRATASDSTQILGAIDQLSAKVRERIGESLRTIRRSPPLSQVTTASLPALRRYTDALEATNAGDDDRALTLLEEAVEIDTTFAMGYRKLGIILRNRGMSRARRLDAFTKAYRHRDRLTERERYLAMASYEEYITGDDDRAIQAYEALIRLDPNDGWALNNLGVRYVNRRDYARAAQLYTGAFEVDSSRLSITNLAGTKAALGDFAAADSILRVAYRLFPGDPTVVECEADIAVGKRDYDRVVAIMDSLAEAGSSLYWSQLRPNLYRSFIHSLRGRPEAFERHLEDVGSYLNRVGMSGTWLAITSAAAGYEADVLGSPERALQRLESTLEQYPLDEIAPSERPYGRLAYAFAVVGQTERARQFLVEAERELDEGLLRQASMLHMGAGYVALAEGRANDAVTEFRRYDEETGCVYCPLHGLGSAYREAGNTDSAVGVLERYVNVTNGTAARLIYDTIYLPGVYTQLGELYEERGDTERAVSCYNELLELWKDAEPVLQPRIDDLRQRIARLVGEPR